ncbi:hypothetical protein IWX84_002635 [Flavobacterium sp. CG_9.10]|uniref:hypothetical protein n=1 Tax=Flavobacterium sp. CG_9.10 TaxID=2787729 RepID=UPI0018CBDC0B|nr:hypothetical protein [Flavobacterium sp. CG_9.10]MBG6111747.1 hypothetical protein [Flavobacterium sp. CG_9.10]
MKLNQEQTQHIFNYFASFDIKWYELQLEFTDHMVSSMEEIWEKDPNLTFEQVKQFTANKFIGDSSFKTIEKERRKILSKELSREHRKMIAKYLTFPKIIGSVSLVYLAYTFSAYFVSPQKYLAVLFSSLLLVGLPLLYYWWKSKEIDGNQFLTLQTLNPHLLVFSFPSLGMNITIQLKQELLEYQWLVLLFCCLWVVELLFMITAIHIQKTTIAKIKKQYQLS